MDSQILPLSDAALNEVLGGRGLTQSLASLTTAPPSTPISSIIKKRDELQMSIIRRM